MSDNEKSFIEREEFPMRRNRWLQLIAILLAVTIATIAIVVGKKNGEFARPHALRFPHENSTTVGHNE